MNVPHEEGSLPLRKCLMLYLRLLKQTLWTLKMKPMHIGKKTQMVSNKSFTDIFFKKVNLEYIIGRANKFVKWNVTYST